MARDPRARHPPGPPREPADPSSPPAPPHEPADRGSGSTQATLGWIVGGLGVVSVGAAVPFFLKSRSKFDEANCEPDCGAEDSKADELHAEGRSAEVTAGVFAGVGGGLVLTGIILLVTSRPSSGSSAATLQPTPVLTRDGARIGFRGAF